MHRRQLVAAVLTESIADLLRHLAVALEPAIAGCTGTLALVTRKQLLVESQKQNMAALSAAVQTALTAVRVHTCLPHLTCHAQLCST